MSDATRVPDADVEVTPLRLWRLALGPLAFLTTLLVPTPEGFSSVAWPVLGLALWMALWWALEAVPLAATSMLPLVIVPLVGVPNAAVVLGEYASSSVMLLLGGFVLALGMERWGLHRRIAFHIMARVGSEPRRLILGVMISTAFISMWVSNTSSALMMLPVALAIASLVESKSDSEEDLRRFNAALLLAVAYGATIGGMGTLIGTPTNALVQGFMARNFGLDIGFVDWLVFGIPTVLLLLPSAWWIMTRWALRFDPKRLPDLAPTVQQAIDALGPVSIPERRVTAIVILAALAWIARPLLDNWAPLRGLNDTAIAVAAGLLMFLLPNGSSHHVQAPASGALLAGADLRRVPWPILLLFGGGLSLAAAIQESTLAVTLGNALSIFGDWPLFALIVVMTVVLIGWTELNSNVATAATFMPVLAALAGASDHPVTALVVPAAIASSAGFMMPVGTPPNALVFGSGRITMRQFLRCGVWINLVAALVISTVGYLGSGVLRQ